MVKLNDLLGIALLLIGIFLFLISLNETTTLIKLTGLIGSSILIVIELFFLWNLWIK